MGKPRSNSNNKRDSSKRRTDRGMSVGRNQDSKSKTSFIEVGPNVPYCYTHGRHGPCFIDVKRSKDKHKGHSSDLDAGDVIVFKQKGARINPRPHSGDGLRYYQQMHQIPKNLYPMSGMGPIGGVPCQDCSMYRIAYANPERCMPGQHTVVRCPVCQANFGRSQGNLPRAAEFTDTSGSSSISDTEDATYIQRPQLSKPRYFSSPRRLIKPHYTYTSEPEIIQQRRPMIYEGQMDGTGWSRQPVQLVYGSPRRPSPRRQEGPRRRAKSAFQSIRRLDSDLRTSRVNGPARILYASKPDTPNYSGDHNVVRKELSSSSESISTSVTSLVNQSPKRASAGLDVGPNRPYDDQMYNGGDRIKFETTRPAGIPYFDETMGTRGNFNGNGRNGTVKPSNHLQLDRRRMPPQTRVGYHEDQLGPRSHGPKDPNLNTSFNFQVGMDPRISNFTPDPSLGPVPNIRIQGRSKTSGNSSTSLATDTPSAGNILDDTLDTGLARVLPTSFNTHSEATKRLSDSESDVSGKQEPCETREPMLLLNGNEVAQKPVLERTLTPDRGLSSVPSHGQSAGDQEEEMEFNTESKGPSTPITLRQPESSPVRYQHQEVGGPKSDETLPVRTLQQKVPPREVIDLTGQVKIQIGSLIQQRLKDLSRSLNDRDFRLVPSQKASDLKKNTAMGKQNPKTRTEAKQSQIPQSMDSFIDQQFGGLENEASESSIRPGEVAKFRPLSETTYVNFTATEQSHCRTPMQSSRGVSEKRDSIRTSFAEMGTPYSGSSRRGFPSSIQQGAMAPQSVKELTGISGDSYSFAPSDSASLSIPNPTHCKPPIEDFRLVAVLGQGNFGKVFLTEFRQTNTFVAFKTFKKVDLLQRNSVDCIKIEKRILQMITEAHQHFLVHMIGCFQTQAYAIIVLEYLPGGDLLQHIQKGAFGEERTVFYAACVVLALDFLHLNKIIYRDLKLENLLLAGTGYLKLVDFGLCKENMGPHDKTSTFCGTPEFVAPEMLTGNGYTRAVDWWALGVLIYEMIVGKCPFSGPEDDETFKRIVRTDPKIPYSVGPKVTSVITAFLTKDPTKRLGSTTNGVMEIMKHPFFSSINFDALMGGHLVAPFIPKIVNMEDVSNFDKRYTSEVPRLTPTGIQISPREELYHFEDFDFYN